MMGGSSRKRHAAASAAAAAPSSSSSTAGAGAGAGAGRAAATLTIAVPGTVVGTGARADLQAVIVGQIARAAAVFRVSEVVVFTEDGAVITETQAETAKFEAHRFFLRLLQYMDTPPHLRRSLFPFHVDLRNAGLLVPLATPPHPGKYDAPKHPYREGVAVTDEDGVTAGGANGTLIDVGLPSAVLVPHSVPLGSRVTVRLDEASLPHVRGGRGLYGTVVAPEEPQTAAGVYWGYRTRMAAGISGVFSECPYEGGYDMRIGVSADSGESTLRVADASTARHVLVVFGGPNGLDGCMEGDQRITETKPEEIFDHVLHVLPNRGTRDLRTEEMAWVALAQLAVAGLTPAYP